MQTCWEFLFLEFRFLPKIACNNGFLPRPQRSTKPLAALEDAKVSPPSCFPAQSCALGVTKVPVFIMFSPLPKWRFPPSKSPERDYLSCSPLCPGGVPRFRCYQRCRYLSCSHLACPGDVSRLRSHHSVPTHRVPLFCPGGVHRP